MTKKAEKYLDKIFPNTQFYSNDWSQLMTVIEDIVEKANSKNIHIPQVMDALSTHEVYSAGIRPIQEQEWTAKEYHAAILNFLNSNHKTIQCLPF